MSQRLHTAVAATAFTLTGVGVALPGSVLPGCLHIWQLSDASGGLLLLASWSGSTFGALAAHRPMRFMPAAGLTATAIALLGLARAHPVGLLLLFALYGLGLGITMTSISALQSLAVPAGNVEPEMNRLNLLWAAGACLAPLFALRLLRQVPVFSVFAFAGALFFASALLLFLTYRPRITVTPIRATPPARLRPAVPWTFCFFAAASVGLESAVGSWLATYAERTGAGVGTALSATTAFWAGLLISRAAHCLPADHWIHSAAVRTMHLLLAGSAVAALILVPTPWITPAAGLLCGLGLGPLYPWVLSVALPVFRSTSLFLMAGLGSALIPWCTGALSTRLHSLRMGLLAPAMTFVLLWLSRVWLKRRDPATDEELRYDAESHPTPGW